MASGVLNIPKKQGAGFLPNTFPNLPEPRRLFQDLIVNFTKSNFHRLSNSTGYDTTTIFDSNIIRAESGVYSLSYRSSIQNTCIQSPEQSRSESESQIQRHPCPILSASAKPMKPICTRIGLQSPITSNTQSVQTQSIPTPLPPHHSQLVESFLPIRCPAPHIPLLAQISETLRTAVTASSLGSAKVRGW